MKKTEKVVSLRLKTVCIIVFVSAVFCLVAILMSIRYFSQSNEQNYRDYAWDLAMTAAALTDPQDIAMLRNDVETILESIPEAERFSGLETGASDFENYIAHFASVQETGEYLRTMEVLERIQAENIAESIYIWYPRGEEKQTVYLADAAIMQCLPGVIDPLYEQNWYILNQPEVGLAPYITKTDTYGWLCTSAVPIRDADSRVIAYVGADIRMNDIKGREKDFCIRLTAVMGCLTIVTILIYIFALNRLMINPINLLAEAAERYGKGKGGRVFADLKIDSKDEIGNLAETMRRMEADNESYIDELTEMTARQQHHNTELEVARKVLEQILPDGEPSFPGHDEFDLYAIMKPQSAIGADAYDYCLLDDDHLVISITDVSEKGIPAALYMMRTQTMLRGRARRGGMPSDMLKDINALLCDSDIGDAFVTAWLGIINLKNGKVIAANAGHEYPVIRRRGEDFEPLRSSHCPPLGASEDTIYANESFTLGKGDTLFLYTDGVSEAKNEDGKRFTMMRMIDTLNKESEETDAKGLVEAVEREVGEFAGTADPYDDITMLAIRYFGRKGK